MSTIPRTDEQGGFTMSSLPVTYEVPYPHIERMAQAVVKSQLFGLKSVDQAIALMLIAQAHGLHPAIAAQDFDVIQGRPSKKAEAMLRDFLAAGGKVHWHELSDTIADATFSHPAGGELRIVWDMARAERAGLKGRDMWTKYPRQMLRSRCVSEGVRSVFPSATSGLYEPGEVADIEPPMKDVTPPKSEPVTPITRDGPMNSAQLKELEAHIASLGIPRERAVKRCQEMYKIDDLPALTFLQWREVKELLPHWAAKVAKEKARESHGAPILTGKGGMDVGAVEEPTPINEEAAALRVKAYAIREGAEHAEGETHRRELAKAAELERQAWALEQDLTGLRQ